MVSFSCDGCGDVVKKPKLPQHYNRCWSPFTCLDCSVQFPTPKEAHSSCITEDEKYQKSLYKGKKMLHKPQEVPNKSVVENVKPARQEPQEQTAAPSEKRKENKRMASDESKKKTKKQKLEKDTHEKQASTLKKTVTLETVQSVVAELSKHNDKVALTDVIEKIASQYHLNAKDVKSRLLKKMYVSIGQKGAVVLQ